MSLVDNREMAREALFFGELPYQPMPEEADIGIAGLLRVYTPKRGRNGGDLNDALSRVPDQVIKILVAQQVVATQCDNGDAVFSFIDMDTPTARAVIGVTAYCMQAWEKAMHRSDGPSLLNPTQDIKTKTDINERLGHLLGAQSLVIETATAAAETLSVWCKNPNKPSDNELKNLSKVLSNWGPRFLTEWMNGSILDGWLKVQKLDEEEIAHWREIFTDSLKKHFAVENINDPLNALSRVKEHLETTLRDESIAERLGWSVEQVKEIFTDSLKKRFAVGNIGDPLKGIADYVDGVVSYGGTYYTRNH